MTQRQSPIDYSDNVLVKRYKGGVDYLQVVFREPFEGRSIVYLNRYCVPGRCDTYHFEWVDGGSGYGWRICYFSDGSYSMPKAMSMLGADLDKPQVVDLLLRACAKPRLRQYMRVLIDDLIGMLAPKSKSYKALKRLQSKQALERSEAKKKTT